MVIHVTTTRSGDRATCWVASYRLDRPPNIGLYNGLIVGVVTNFPAISDMGSNRFSASQYEYVGGSPNVIRPCRLTKNEPHRRPAKLNMKLCSWTSSPSATAGPTLSSQMTERTVRE